MGRKKGSMGFIGNARHPPNARGGKGIKFYFGNQGALGGLEILILCPRTVIIAWLFKAGACFGRTCPNRFNAPYRRYIHPANYPSLKEEVLQNEEGEISSFHCQDERFLCRRSSE